uniref:Ankyrin repeat protein n=1 Tax=viral metagenome TaxID=1070528 RepID=A0A6C0E8D5_9ZZZZ
MHIKITHNAEIYENFRFKTGMNKYTKKRLANYINKYKLEYSNFAKEHPECFDCLSTKVFSSYDVDKYFEKIHNFDYFSNLVEYILKFGRIPPQKLWVRFVMRPNHMKHNGFTTSKIILSEKYPLCDIKTVTKCNMKLKFIHIIFACVYGKTDVLSWFKDNNDDLSEFYINNDVYSDPLGFSALYFASSVGNVNVLEWWKNAGLDIEFQEYNIMFPASINGHINVLDWCLKYNNNSFTDPQIHAIILFASMSGQIKVLEWFKKIGLKFDEFNCTPYMIADPSCDYLESVINEASLSGHYELLEWLKQSGFAFESKDSYDERSLAFIVDSDNILEYKDIPNAQYRPSFEEQSKKFVKTLEWWKHSGLPLKYSEKSMDMASSCGLVDVLEWWRNSGLPLKYSENSLNYASRDGQIEVLKWWFNSGLPLKYSENTLDYACNRETMKTWFDSNVEIKYTEEDIEWIKQQNLKPDDRSVREFMLSCKLSKFVKLVSKCSRHIVLRI